MIKTEELSIEVIHGSSLYGWKSEGVETVLCGGEVRPAVPLVGSGVAGVRVVLAETGGEVVMARGSRVGVRACDIGRLG